jgi:hypothetical protein
MKSLLLCLVLSLSAFAQCNVYDTLKGPFNWFPYNTIGHIDGDHFLDNVEHGKCSYTGRAGEPCDVTDFANSYTTGGDVGSLLPLTVHEVFTSDSPQTTTAVNGQGAEATASGTGYAVSCIGYCPFQQSTIWSPGTNSYKNVCVGRTGYKYPPPGPRGPCPIVIDTTGNGFHFTDPKKACVTFKWGNKLKCTSWPEAGSGNAWLVHDTKGVIDGADDLFGNFTPHADGGEKGHPSPNGFLALAWYDHPAQGGNGDLVIDNRDQIWPSLYLWIDTHCSKTPKEPCTALPSELFSLEEKGVYSLSLVYNDPQTTDQWGNLFKFSVVVNPEPIPGTINHKSRDGRLAYDVFLVESK